MPALPPPLPPPRPPASAGVPAVNATPATKASAILQNLRPFTMCPLLGLLDVPVRRSWRVGFGGQTPRRYPVNRYAFQFIPFPRARQPA